MVILRKNTFALWSFVLILNFGVSTLAKTQFQKRSEEVLALGSFEVQDRHSPFIISAPHGQFDANTEMIVRKILSRLRWSGIVATGFRTAEHPYNVNRPTEGVGLEPSEELVTDDATLIFEKYLEYMSSLNSEMAKLYVEIHGNNRALSESRLEIATQGISSSTASKIKKLFERECEKQGLSGLGILVQPIDDLHFCATGAKQMGALGKVRAGLHIEIPLKYRTQYISELIEVLSQVLPAIEFQK